MIEQSESQEVSLVKKTRQRSTSHLSNQEASQVRTSGEFQIQYGDRYRPRQSNENDDLNLSIPAGVIPEGFVAQWVIDDGKGSLDRKLGDWWAFITDSQGMRYARPTGGGKTQYLMVIEKSYYDESESLRISRYRASIGEDDSKSLGVQGLDAYTPNGEANKIKVTTDPFAS
jgi:hypothetical protein